MDLFYQSCRPNRRERIHFHSFMNRVHAALKRTRNTSNPLRRVARDIAARTRVLCLDEFVIIDIGDAMIMAGLARGPVRRRRGAGDDFERGAASSTATACSARVFCRRSKLIERFCEVVNLDGEQDYRLRFLQTNRFVFGAARRTPPRRDSRLSRSTRRAGAGRAARIGGQRSRARASLLRRGHGLVQLRRTLRNRAQPERLPRAGAPVSIR